MKVTVVKRGSRFFKLQLHLIGKLINDFNSAAWASFQIGFFILAAVPNSIKANARPPQYFEDSVFDSKSYKKLLILKNN